MRKLRKLSMAVVLTLAFATYGFAGIIGTGPEAPPPPSAQQSVMTAIVVALVQIAVR